MNIGNNKVILMNPLGGLYIITLSLIHGSSVFKLIGPVTWRPSAICFFGALTNPIFLSLHLQRSAPRSQLTDKWGSSPDIAFFFLSNLL